MSSRLFRFIGGAEGVFQITSIRAVQGEGLPPASRLSVEQGPGPDLPDAAFVLSGVTSNDRYVTREEKTALTQVQKPLGRPECSLGALIPIKKSAAWWDLSQDERREIFEERSRHIQLGTKALPAVARRLHHSRDLGEPFDFLTWFDFSPEDEPAFTDLLGALRATEEWAFVEREVEIRVVRG